MQPHTLKQQFPLLELPLIKAFVNEGSFVEITKGTTLMRQDAYVPAIPVVLSGLVKVFSRYEDRELLLYYIKPAESCIMSFSSCLQGNPSQVYATTEEDSTLLLLPINKITQWLKAYPSFNNLFYSQFDTRYTDLLTNIQQLLFHKIDQRLLDYITQKLTLTKAVALQMTHLQIANELGTVREVISRTLKKLEVEGKITQNPQGISVV